MEEIRKLTHSEFIVYSQQIRAGKSHEEALEYTLKNKLNTGEYLYKMLKKN